MDLNNVQDSLGINVNINQSENIESNVETVIDSQKESICESKNSKEKCSTIGDNIECDNTANEPELSYDNNAEQEVGDNVSNINESQNKIEQDTTMSTPQQIVQNSSNNENSEIQRLNEQYANLEMHSKKVQKELELQVHNLKKQYDRAVKETESAVMRYAVSEKNSLDIKQLKKESDILQGKLKMASNERTRICSILDNKCHELTSTQKECERLKNELGSLDGKLKWSNVCLKQEKEARMILEERCQKITAEIEELRTDKQLVEQASNDSQRLANLEQQLTEKQAELILEKHKRNDLDLKCIDLLNHLTQSKSELDYSRKESLNLKEKVTSLESLIEELETKTRETRAKELEITHKELFEAHTTILRNEQEIDRLQLTNTEMQQELYDSRKQQMEMLIFTQQLTEKNVSLQGQFSSLEAKIIGFSSEQSLLNDSIEEQRIKIIALRSELDEEKKRRAEEAAVLAKHLAVKTEAVQHLETQLEETKGEIQVLKRKHQTVIKELNRELQLALRSKKSMGNLPEDQKGSNSSISSSEPTHSNGDAAQSQFKEPDRQALVERIVKLQRVRAKQAEKLDFLEEHCRALVAEIQRKSKVMQSIMLHDCNHFSTQNGTDKLTFNGASSDDSSVDMSQQNAKLQAILEDTLFKNVALKESVDTLATEVARLNKIINNTK